MRIPDISIGLGGVLFGITLASGCGGERHVIENEGAFCVYPASDSGTGPFQTDTTLRQFTAGEPLTVSVLFPLCLSGSCTSERTASCTVEQVASTFVVTGRASYWDTGAAECTTDCVMLGAQCATPAAPAGTFEVNYAGGSVQVVVPSLVRGPCAGDPVGAP